MKHIKFIAKTWDLSLSELKTDERLMKVALALSSRIEILELFISNETEYDGEKVGFTTKYGVNKKGWKK